MASSEEQSGTLARIFPVDSASAFMRRLIDIAIDGVSALPGARSAAKGHLEKTQSADRAIDALIRQHIGLAGAQGFITNIGGIAAMAVGLPANLVGLLVIQARMVAAIAHLRGYDLSAPQVRTAVGLALLGGAAIERGIESGRIPTRPLVIATAPIFDEELQRSIDLTVLGVITGQTLGRGAALMVTKRIPFLGGGVGAAFDGWGTLVVGAYAKEEFLRRSRN